MSSPDSSAMWPQTAKNIMRSGLLVLAVVLSFYAWNLAVVIQAASSAPSYASGQGTIVLLGKHAPGEVIDQDFRARLDRVQQLLEVSPDRPLVLSGGGLGKSEARIAWENLQDTGSKHTWRIEQASRTTLENLVNTKDMLTGSDHSVAVVSSRYHMARIERLARSIDFQVNLVAAEDRLTWDVGTSIALLREAAYLSLLTIYLL